MKKGILKFGMIAMFAFSTALVLNSCGGEAKDENTTETKCEAGKDGEKKCEGADKKCEGDHKCEKGKCEEGKCEGAEKKCEGDHKCEEGKCEEGKK